MTKLIGILTALLNLLDQHLTSKARDKRAKTEQEIKENPRAFFQQGNTNSKQPPAPDSVSANSKK